MTPPNDTVELTVKMKLESNYLSIWKEITLLVFSTP